MLAFDYLKKGGKGAKGCFSCALRHIHQLMFILSAVASLSLPGYH